VPWLHNADFLRRAKEKVSENPALDVLRDVPSARHEPISGFGVAPRNIIL
jgi:hypothetical protein